VSNSDDDKKVLVPEVVDEQPTSAPPAPEKKKRDFVGERKARRARARNTAFKKLNVQQQKFVLGTIATNDPKEAARQAGYAPSGSNNALTTRAHNLLSSPKVVNALEEKLNELYPDLKDKIAHRLDGVLNKTVVSGKAFGPMNPMPPDCITIEEFLKVVDTMIRVNGWEAAKKSAHIRANVPAGSFLPGSKK
jgi:hypothetical protein